MKKLSVFAIAMAAMVFAACGGNKSAQNTESADSLKSFEQEQIEASIKMQLDSIASEVGKLKLTSIFQKDAEGGLKLTKEEMQVKPEYLLAASVAENATTLAEKYRMISALDIDKRTAALYEMPVDEYTAAINKLAADINDPSFKILEEGATVAETTEDLYNEMSKNGRINYFWQMASASLVEQLYVVSQNSDKFLSVIDDEAAANISFRVVLVLDGVKRLSEYDPEIKVVGDALAPLDVLNAMTVDELKSQIADAKNKIEAARAALIK